MPDDSDRLDHLRRAFGIETDSGGDDAPARQYLVVGWMPSDPSVDYRDRTFPHAHVDIGDDGRFGPIRYRADLQRPDEDPPAA